MITTLKAFITRHAYRREIIGIIILKIVALFLLWFICIKPQTISLLTPEHIAMHFLGSLQKD